jgi:hypothetical protein
VGRAVGGDVVDDDVVEVGRGRDGVRIGHDEDKPLLAAHGLADADVVHAEVDQSEAVQIAGHVAADEDAVVLAAGRLKILDLPVLLVVEADSVRIGPCVDLAVCRAAAVGAEVDR